MSDEHTKKMEALFGGKVISVTFRDGRTEEVRVRELPIRRFPDFFTSLQDEGQLLALVTGQDEETIDKLSDESHEALVEAAMDVNFTRAERWLERQAKLGERLQNNPAVKTAAALQKTLQTSPSAPVAP